MPWNHQPRQRPQRRQKKNPRLRRLLKQEKKKPKLKKSKAGGKDEEFYIPYRPRDFDSERG